MPDLTVLVVDDSAVVRRLVERALSCVPGLRVITAGNATLAVARVRSEQISVAVLDIEMPDSDGLATLLAVREVNATLPVVIFAGERGVQSSSGVEMQAVGVSAIIAKPSRLSGSDDVDEVIRASLLPAVLAAAAGPSRRAVAPPPPHRVAAPPAPRTGRAGGTAVEIVAIGSSTGGPDALTTVLSGLPASLPVPIVISQHIPAAFSRLLAERLSFHCPLPVAEAHDGQPLQPGHAYLAPGDYHLEVARRFVGGRPHVCAVLHQGPRESSCRPAVDPLLRSVAQVYGAAALAVILTGMGSDGMLGARAIRTAGGEVVVQDEQTSVVWGMPGAVAGDGQADAVLPITRIADAILGRVARRARVLL